MPRPLGECGAANSSIPMRLLNIRAPTIWRAHRAVLRARSFFGGNMTRAPANSIWPALPLEQWEDTFATLHMWSQIVGKTRLALVPMMNHWWNVTLYVTARGLTTGPMPSGERTFEVELDFLDHVLALRVSDGATRTLRLAPRSVAEFYREYLAMLESLGLAVRIRPLPVEVVEAVPFPDDQKHAAYDADVAQRCFRVLAQADRVLKEFRGHFLGKCSPVHLFWGAFDLACTRFSGRPAPLHPGGVPNCPDYVQHEAYSHECISAGWWPGGGPLREAAFYAYAYPSRPACPRHPSARPRRTTTGRCASSSCPTKPCAPLPIRTRCCLLSWRPRTRRPPIWPVGTARRSNEARSRASGRDDERATGAEGSRPRRRDRRLVPR